MLVTRSILSVCHIYCLISDSHAKSETEAQMESAESKMELSYITM